eukprot:TRINITY_DN9847_c0_g1_i5.p1 TRINITY_DN9847_c0_g1~~TRINITY_DN9847_c0_g1_i5.p1  ORF type:complete len:298 (+),score=79.60 TRINITY_DN9847_c0_g1_i5:118-1011(+)
MIIRNLFDPKYGMFVYDEESRNYWFNTNSFESDSEFELIGILLGLAIFNGVILDVHFPRVVYKKLLRRKLTLDDLETLNPSLAKGLRQLLAFDGDVENTYLRTFSVEREVFGENVMVELKPNGSEILLNNENRQEYVDLYMKYMLETSIESQYRAFESGFMLVAGGEPLQMFEDEELELVICGSPEPDFEALEKATQYEPPLSENSRIIKNFWRAVHSLTSEEKRKFLAFCTGSDRVPIKGLGTLQFTISRAGGDANRLISSHTCFNHILLPEYSTYEQLRERLLQSIENNEGFGLM